MSALLNNIVFDIGGVLLNYKPQEYLVKKYPVDKAWDLLHLMYLSDEWKQLDIGALSFEEAAIIFTSKKPELAEDIKYLISKESFSELLTPIKETEEYIKELKARGKKIYLLSNYSIEGFTWLQETHDFWKLADGMIISSHVRLSKPDPAIYRLLAKTYRLDPQESVFTDDSSVNVEAARKEGFHAFVFEGIEDCRRQIELLDQAP
jgi:putative hydrolase of the HAD superfamily